MMTGAEAAILDHEVNIIMDTFHSKEIRQKPGCLFPGFRGKKKKILCCLSHYYFRFSVIHIQTFS